MGQGQTTPGDKSLMSTETSCHFGHCYKFQKKSLRSLILYSFFFFHDFIHVYIPGTGADSPQGTKFWCQHKCLITSFICCKFQKNVFEAWFYTIFFMIKYMYIDSPGAGADNPQGTKFWCQQKGLITLPIWCKFQRNLFEVWFYTNLHVYSPRAGGKQPPWDKVLMSTETSCHSGHLLLVSNHRRQ